MSNKKCELYPFNEEILSVMNNIIKNSKQKINKLNIAIVPKDFKENSSTSSKYVDKELILKEGKDINMI